VNINPIETSKIWQKCDKFIYQNWI